MSPSLRPVNPLPKPSTFLTDLLTTLSNLPKPQIPEADAASTRSTSLAKPYLLTLHALFPSTLLPALDLLDRRLVSRHVLSEQSEAANNPSETLNSPSCIKAPEAPSKRETVGPGRASTDVEISIEPPAAGCSPVNQNGPLLPAIIPNNQATAIQASRSQGAVYYVKSSQWHQSSKLRHFGGYSSGSGGMLKFDRSYEVRPWAWSCTCAAFAFAAFNHEAEDEGDGNDGLSNCNCGSDDAFGKQMVVRDSYRKDGNEGDGEHVEDTEGTNREEIEGSAWGGLMGLYRNRGKGDVAPLCKHLLACVLAEWWGEARNLVEIQVMEKEEMAGWAAGWGE